MRLRWGRAVLLAMLLGAGPGCGHGRGALSEADAAPDGASDAASDSAAADVARDTGGCDCTTPAVTCVDAGAAAGAIPLGEYTQCQSTVVQAGNTAQGPGGTLTLTGSDGELQVAVNKGVFAVAPGTLSFVSFTGATAVAAIGQTYGTFNVPCARSTIKASALALDGDTLVVSLVGDGCEDDISGTLRCHVPAAPTGVLTAPGACSSAQPCTCDPPAFPSGTYDTCTTSVPGFGAGQLVLARDGSAVTATLDGLVAVAPMKESLRFTASSATSAAAVPGQTWVVNRSGITTPFVPVTMTVTSGSLVIDGKTVFAFVGGTDGTSDLQELFHCTAKPKP